MAGRSTSSSWEPGSPGLTAALLLKQAGHRVTLLEAQNRIGGRILTHRGFAGRMYGEFGAMRFPLRHELVQHLIQERFKLATKPFPMAADNLIYPQGHAVRNSNEIPWAGIGGDEPEQRPTLLTP